MFILVNKKLNKLSKEIPHDSYSQLKKSSISSSRPNGWSHYICIIYMQKNHNLKIQSLLFCDLAILGKINLIHNFAPHCRLQAVRKFNLRIKQSHTFFCKKLIIQMKISILWFKIERSLELLPILVIFFQCNRK